MIKDIRSQVLVDLMIAQADFTEKLSKFLVLLCDSALDALELAVTKTLLEFLDVLFLASSRAALIVPDAVPFSFLQQKDWCLKILGIYQMQKVVG
ncbi:hypothetical protein COL922a_004888 [Colletotrichum nupharicola]|nr:hypothetical protein COL922a_004888 [Colletotrichum nupharicola]